MPRVAVKDAAAKGKGGGGGRTMACGMLPFAVARAIVWKLKLKSKTEWEVWLKSGKRPTNIPAGPANTYRDDGWTSWPDWLGYEGTNMGHKGVYLSFEAAKAAAQSALVEHVIATHAAAAGESKVCRRIMC